VESDGRNSFRFLSKGWISLGWITWNSRLL